MLCYKEVHKYNGNYYSGFDNGYVYKLGEVMTPSGNDYIYATDTIENVIDYGYCKYDMAILEMEIPEGTEYYQRGYIITTKAAKILREVDKYGNNAVAEDESSTDSFMVFEKERLRILSMLQQGIYS